MEQQKDKLGDAASGPGASGVPSETDTATPSLTPPIAGGTTYIVSTDKGPHFIPPRRRNVGASTLLSLAAMLGGIGGAMGMPLIKGGSGLRDPHRKRPNTDNSEDRAKGMKRFDISGVTVYAGTLKAARKKAKLLLAQGIVTAAESGSHSDATEPVDSPVAKGDVPKPH